MNETAPLTLPLRRAFFYCASPELSPAYQCLAPGLQQLGIGCYYNADCPASVASASQALFSSEPTLTPDDCDVVIVDSGWLEQPAAPFRAYPERPAYLFHPQRRYATVYLHTQTTADIPACVGQFDLVLAIAQPGDRAGTPPVQHFTYTTPEATAKLLLQRLHALVTPHRRRARPPLPVVLPRPEGWSELNLLLCPDWTQPEANLKAALQAAIRALARHPASPQMTLLVECAATGLESAQLLLSVAAMDVLLAEPIDDCAATVLPIAVAEAAEWLALGLHLHVQLRGPGDRALELPIAIPEVSVAEFPDLPARQLWQAAGDRLASLGQWATAARDYQLAIAAEPAAALYWSLSQCYAQLQQPHKRLAALTIGQALEPAAAYVHFQLIFEAQHRGQIWQAIAQAHAAAECCPHDYTFQLLYRLLMPLVYEQADEIAEYRDRFTSGLQVLLDTTLLETAEQQQNALAGINRLTNFYRAYQADNVRSLQQRYGQLVSQITAANYPQWMRPLTLSPRRPGQKIRIGYASAYLQAYSGTLWLTGWLKYADRQQFEIYCYHTGTTVDRTTEFCQEHCDVFHHLPYGLETVCRQIRADELDILVFPELGMDAPMFAIASLRLAPIQCTAWGHPVTTGLPNVDYFLSSELMEPDNAQEHYSETLIRLPKIGVAYPQPDIPELTKTRADFGLAATDVLYLCCQAPFKYLPQYDYLFPAIAQQVPQAKFIWLRATLLEQRLIRAFAAAGYNYQDYCYFLTIPERQDYLAINQLADVYLDTFDWSGGNTSLEAIACHLPIVTCPGEFMRGRHTDSFLKAIGVTATLARDAADYLDIAIRLGRDPGWRQSIRQQLQERSDRLYEDRDCVRGLEAFYQAAVAERRAAP